MEAQSSDGESLQSYQVSAINNNPPLKAFNHLNVSQWMEARAPDWYIENVEQTQSRLRTMFSDYKKIGFVLDLVKQLS